MTDTNPDRTPADLPDALVLIDQLRGLLTILAPPEDVLVWRLETAANEWSIQRQDDSPLPGFWDPKAIEG